MSRSLLTASSLPLVAVLSTACFSPDNDGSTEESGGTTTSTVTTDGPTTSADPDPGSSGSSGPGELSTSGSSTTGSSSSGNESSETSAGSGSSSTGSGCVRECAADNPPSCDGDSSEERCVRGEDGCLELRTTACDEGFVCVPKVGCQEVFAASCAEILAENPGTPDGPQTIDPDGMGGEPPVETLCDMTTDGGGWTLIAANDAPTTFVEFDRTWAEYRAGFGDLTGGLGWLGNQHMHTLTADGLDLEVRHDMGVHDYVDFSVGDEASQYALSVTNTPTSGDAGRFQSYHSGLPFSTHDTDNDTIAENCADNFGAGWWYADCFAMSIASGNDGGGAYWRTPGDGALFVDWIEMWVR